MKWKMDKKTTWIIVIVAVIIILGLLIIFRGGKDQENNGSGIIVTDEPVPGTDTTGDANAENLDTSDDVFAQLDDAANYAD